MFLSVFDIFKIGVGPSSSHTMGPMVAAGRFLAALREGDLAPGAGAPAALSCTLRGSLAFTGKGHATDRAVALGLAGFEPATLDADAADAALETMRAAKRIDATGLGRLAFDPDADIVFDYGPPLPGHANGMILTARDAAGLIVLTETYYSTGGGFVATERELERGESTAAGVGDNAPFPFRTAAEMLAMAETSGLSIAEMKRRNELATMTARELEDGLDGIWAAMNTCIDRGLAKGGILPGGLGVRRRAQAIHGQLIAERGANQAQPHVANDWMCAYAMAVNEENAAGGRVVTAPTNGASGTLPGVFRYYLDHMVGASRAAIPDMLLTAAAVGGLIKTNASISGAEVGCQGEVGSAAAMAAAGLAHALGGSPRQIENAAEIALEHHLGMTCDPIRGLVQAPCIERNGLGAIKAVSAASLAVRGDGAHLVSLDACVETMRQTGRDMDARYKETSRGGLAVNMPEC